MASSTLIPSNGAVVLGSQVADFHEFNLDAEQAQEDVTPYGTSVISARIIGNGTPKFTGSVNAFALAHATNTAPGFGSTSGIVYNSQGVAGTFTLDTGVSEAFAAISVGKVSIQHGRMKAAVNMNFNWSGNSDPTETWATT